MPQASSFNSKFPSKLEKFLTALAKRGNRKEEITESTEKEKNTQKTDDMKDHFR